MSPFSVRGAEVALAFGVPLSLAAACAGDERRSERCGRACGGQEPVAPGEAGSGGDLGMPGGSPTSGEGELGGAGGAGGNEAGGSEAGSGASPDLRGTTCACEVSHGCVEINDVCETWRREDLGECYSPATDCGCGSDCTITVDPFFYLEIGDYELRLDAETASGGHCFAGNSHPEPQGWQGPFWQYLPGSGFIEADSIFLNGHVPGSAEYGLTVELDLNALDPTLRWPSAGWQPLPLRAVVAWIPDPVDPTRAISLVPADSGITTWRATRVIDYSLRPWPAPDIEPQRRGFQVWIEGDFSSTFMATDRDLKVNGSGSFACMTPFVVEPNASPFVDWP